MTEREIAAVLCGLRILQRVIERHGEPLGDMDILTCNGDFSPLTTGQIDELCETVAACGLDAVTKTNLACTAKPEPKGDREPRDATDHRAMELLRKLRAKIGAANKVDEKESDNGPAA